MKRYFFILALWSFCSASYGLDLDSLLVKSVGGPEAVAKLKQLQSFEITGSLDINGLKGNFRELFGAPDKFYLEADFGGFRLVQAYDGQTAWQTDQNGQTEILSGFERLELIKNLYFESYAYLFPDRVEGSREYRGIVSKDGRDYHEVWLSPMNEDTVSVLFDTESGLRYLMTSRIDNMLTEATVDRYDTVQGIVFAAISRSVAPEVPMTSIFEAKSIILDPQIEPSLFSPPISDKIDFRFPDGAEAVTIPIEYKRGHIRVPVTINGKKKAWFILDSGASSNIFHKPFVSNLNLEVVGSIPAKGFGGYEDAQMLRSDSLQIGALTLYNQVSGALDLSALDYKREGQFGGLLGYDFLSRFPVMVDQHGGKLTVFNPVTFVPPDSGVEIPFYMTMQVPTVAAELNGIPGNYIIDLGNAYGLIVHKKFSDDNQLEQMLDNVTDVDSRIGGVGGELSGKTAFAASFQMGDVLIQSIRVILPETTFGLSGSEDLAGNIGNLVLEQFRTLFDYKNSRLILYPSDNP